MEKYARGRNQKWDGCSIKVVALNFNYRAKILIRLDNTLFSCTELPSNVGEGAGRREA